MKKILSILLPSIVLCSSLSAVGDVFIQGASGINLTQPFTSEDQEFTFSSGYFIGGSLGFSLPARFRIECEVSTRQNKVKMFTGPISGEQKQMRVKGRMEQMISMGNLLFDIPFMGLLTPYIGGGIGIEVDRMQSSYTVPDVDKDGKEIKRNVNLISERRQVSSYQAIGGLNFNWSDKTRVTLNYHYTSGFDSQVISTTFAFALFQSF